MSNRNRNYFFANLKSKPYALFGIAGFLMAIISFIPIKRDSLDVNLHDTYFVIANVSFFRWFAAILLFLWAIYIATSRLMFSRRLIWFHVIATLLPVIFLMIFNNHTWGMSGSSKRYYAIDEFENSKSFFNDPSIYIVSILVLLIAQFLFAINLVIGIIRFFRQNNPESKSRF
jgi:heme/copper-type cytochrome/quinol oxidase subunit 1